MAKEIDKIIGLLLGIIALVLIVITFFVNLATITDKVSYLGFSYSQTTNTTFFGSSYAGHYSSWSNLTKGMTGSELAKATSGVDMIYASIATMVLAAIFVVLGIITAFAGFSGMLKKIAILFPILSAIFIILTIVLYYEGATTIVNAMKTAAPAGYLFSTTISLAVGAYLAIGALILELLVVIFNFLGFGKAKASKN